MRNYSEGPFRISGDGAQVFNEEGMVADCRVQLVDDDELDSEKGEQESERCEANAVLVCQLLNTYYMNRDGATNTIKCCGGE